MGGKAMTSRNACPRNNFRAYSPQTAGDSRPQPDTPMGLRSLGATQKGVPAVDPLPAPSRMTSRGHEREPNAALCGRLALLAEGDCLPESPGLGWAGLGWAFTPGADCDVTRSLAADIRKGKRAAWFMVPVALG